MQAHNNPPILPKRIILLRHGESQGNMDAKTYTTIPDNKIPLTEKGLVQAWGAGVQIRDVISCNNTTSNWKVYFYVSPYQRTLSTLREIGLSFSRKEIIGVDEDCRLREQAFGNFQDEKKMKELKIKKEEYGRFFYRFPDGESIAALSDRVSGTIFSLSLLNLLIQIFFWLLLSNICIFVTLCFLLLYVFLFRSLISFCYV